MEMLNSNLNKILIVKMSIEDYEIINKIGKGSFGTIYLVKNKDNKLPEKLVMKVYKDDANIEFLKESLNLAMTLNHQNIMKCFTYTIDNNLVSYLEYILGMNLFQITCKAYKENKLFKMSKKLDIYLPQIIDALNYLHSKKIIHRDIKPENIIANNDEIKLIDHDFLTSYEDKKTKIRYGTPLFLSPEIYKGNIYNEKSDIWALGVTLYFCLKYKYPFDAISGEQLKELLFSHFEPNYDDIPFNYIILIKGYLKKDPQNRSIISS